MEVITKRFFVTLLRHVKTVFLTILLQCENIGPQRPGLARCQPSVKGQLALTGLADWSTRRQRIKKT